MYTRKNKYSDDNWEPTLTGYGRKIERDLKWNICKMVRNKIEYK